MFRKLLATSAIALALVGCGGQGDAPQQTATDGSGETAPADMRPESGINVAALWGGGKSMPLDV